MAFAINPKSTKQEIIDESVAIITDQDERISQLEQQQTALFFAVALLSAWVILF